MCLNLFVNYFIIYLLNRSSFTSRATTHNMMPIKVTSFNDETIRTLPQMRTCTSVSGRVQSTAATSISEDVSVSSKPRFNLKITIWDTESRAYLEFPSKERLHSWTTTLVSKIKFILNDPY